MTYLIIFTCGIIFGIAVFYLVQRLNKKTSQKEIQYLQTQLENTFNQLSNDALKNANDYLLTTANEKLGTEKRELYNDLENKKDTIKNLIEEIRKDIKSSDERLKKSDDDRLMAFSVLKDELESYKIITSELKGSTDNLKDVLSNNQLRGQFGEQIAENLLKMIGFVTGTDYTANQQLDSNKGRPDFTILMHDKTKVNIDVKFPYAALQRYIESKDDLEKIKHFKQFSSDVKEKVKQITSRDYINPQDHTMDFVILFIPNEMIFSFIYENMNNVWEEAMKQKVILVGPFSFTAILRMIKQTYTNFKYQENLHHIITLIQQFGVEFEKYNESIEELGKRITKTSEQFETVSNTRSRQLNRVIDKIKNEEITEEILTN